MLAATQPTKRTDPTSGARLASSQAPRGCNHADRRSPANRPPRTERPPGLSGCHCNARKEKSRDANLSQSDLWSGTPGVTPTYPATAAPWPRRWSTLAPPAGLWPAPPLASFALAARTRAAAPAPWTTLPELVQGSHPAEDLPGGGANRQDARRLVLHQRPAPLRRQPGGDAATQFLPQPRRTCVLDPAGPRPSLVLPREAVAQTKPLV
jgi:hypothetical protein